MLAALATPDRQHDDIRDFAGLWRERPGLAALLTIFLLSLGGFPPTVGFVAKWYIFSAAVQQNLIALAVLGVLTSVISVFFYLRIVVMMYMTDEEPAGQRPALSRTAVAGMVVAMAVVIYLGVMPGNLLSIAADSVKSISSDVRHEGREASEVHEGTSATSASWPLLERRGRCRGTRVCHQSFGPVTLGIPGNCASVFAVRGGAVHAQAGHRHSARGLAARVVSSSAKRSGPDHGCLRAGGGGSVRL